MQEDLWEERPNCETISDNSIYNTINKWKSYVCYDRLKEIYRKRAYVTIPNEIKNIGFTSTEFLDMYIPGIDVLINAHKKHTKVLVWGDYDVDGLTATSSMVTGLQLAGMDVVYANSNRFDHGYGIDVNKIRGLCSPGSLIITVDNGINEYDSVNLLIAEGYSVLVTDHHLPEQNIGTMHEKAVVINPKISLQETDSEYMVPGVYVATKLIYHFLNKLNIKISDNYMNYFKALVAMGIISDVIPMNTVTMHSVRTGLISLQILKHDGIKNLLYICGAKDNQPINERFLSYSVLPKLNACGRMGNTEIGMKILLTITDTSIEKIDVLMLANKLKYINMDRKIIENNIVKEASYQADELIKSGMKSLVLWNDNWHIGVLGIVAARLVERFHVPTIVLSKDLNEPNQYTGSGRTIYDFNIYDAVTSCSDILTSYGGHTAALGVKCSKNNLLNFRNKFDEYIKSHNLPDRAVYTYDTTIDVFNTYDIFFHMAIMNLCPFGNGHEQIILKLLNLKLIYPTVNKESCTFNFEDDLRRPIRINKYPIPVEWKDPRIFADMVKYSWDVLITPVFSYYANCLSVDWQLVSMHRKNKLPTIELN